MECFCVIGRHEAHDLGLQVLQAGKAAPRQCRLEILPDPLRWDELKQPRQYCFLPSSVAETLAHRLVGNRFRVMLPQELPAARMCNPDSSAAVRGATIGTLTRP